MIAGPERGGLIAYFLRHRTAANLLLAAMLVLGLWGAAGIRTQFFPDVPSERIVVVAAWPGAAAEDVDRQIVARLEPALMVVDGVERSNASSREGRASISLTMEPGADMARALEAVEAAVEAERQNLPEAIDTLRIRRVEPRDRVADIVLRGPTSIEQLRRHAADLQADLFRSGVTRIRIDGADDPVIRVSTTEAALSRHRMSLGELADAVTAGAQATPAGSIGDDGARVRAGVENRTVEAVSGLVARREADGGLLLVRDVASVALVGGPGQAAFFVDGLPALRLSVDRGAGGDALRVLAAVDEAIARLSPTLPEGVVVEATRARARQIAERLDLLLENALTGLATVLALLFLFLSARTALWVAMGIPASMAAALGFMHATGMTLDMISLFALILCLGVVVDDAIVVGEHAETLAARGLAPDVAAERAAREMFSPVLAASATTVIAFLGLMVIGGRFGEMIVAIPVVVTAVLAASLIESVLILPAHMRGALAAARRRSPWDWPSRQVDRGFQWVRERLFRPAVTAAVRLRYPVIAAVTGLLLASAGLVASGDLRWRFFDGPESGLIDAGFSMLPGASHADSREMLDELERALDVVNARFAAEHGVAPVANRLGMTGATPRHGQLGDEQVDRDRLGGLAVELVDADLRPYTQNAVLRAWNDETRAHPLLEHLTLRGERGGVGEETLSVSLTGADPRGLKAAAEALKRDLAAFAAVTGVEDGLGYDKEELSLALTPRGEALGFTAQSLAAAVRDRLQGVEAASFPFEGRTATVEVRLDEADLTADWLDRALVRAPDGQWVALSELTTVTRALGFAAVRRENGRLVASVTGEIAADDPAAVAAVTAALRERILPDVESRFDVEATLGGLAEQERRFLNEAALGFALCIVGIYIALAWIFASWRRPVTVLLTIPLGGIGVLWGHHWMGAALSMFSVVGAIGLAGIIINDSIVLSKAADEHARRRALIPAVIEAASDRLRAVFLTTATTVAGMAPLLVEPSTQAQFLKPAVISLCFGLGFGMLLVLAVAPALIAIEGDAARAARALRRLPAALRRMRRRAA